MSELTTCQQENESCDYAKLKSENAALRAELERERMRLAACGAAALGYFEGCSDEYKSASLDDVLRLQVELAALKAGDVVMVPRDSTWFIQFIKEWDHFKHMGNGYGYGDGDGYGDGYGYGYGYSYGEGYGYGTIGKRE